MVRRSEAELAGQRAFAKLEKRVSARWERLSAADRSRVSASTAQTFMERVTWNLHRLGGKPVLRLRVPTLAERYATSALAHLRPGGPEAKRRKLAVEGSEWVLARRPSDSRSVALEYGRHSFDLRQLESLRAAAEKVRGDLHLLLSTPLAGGLSTGHFSSRLLPALSRVLRWYSHRFLNQVIRRAKGIKARALSDTRRIVIKLANDLRIVTGRGDLTLLVDLLNWKAPRKSGEWSAQLLERWLAEAAAKTKRKR